MPRRPEAFEQGTLDGLCGVYSIVNSIVWALRTYPPRERHKRGSRRLPSDAELGDLFVMLLLHLVRGRRHLKPVVEGTNSTQLVRLLSKGSDWLSEHRRLTLVVRQPFQGRKCVPTAHIANTLGRHLARPGSAVIVGIEAPLDHWTVVRQVTRKRLLLLDSAGATHLSMTEWGERCQRSAGLVRPNNIFLVKLTRAPRRPQARVQRAPLSKAGGSTFHSNGTCHDR